MSFVLGGSININYNRNLNINYKSSKEREGFNVTHSLEEGNITKLISILSNPKINLLLKIIRETPKTFEKLL